MLVFFGPLALAAIAYFGPWDWAPRAAHGELIEPPVPLPPGVLAGASQTRSADDRLPNRWLLLYARSSPCGDECVEHLVRLHQVRLALAEDRDRVQIALFLSGADVPRVPGARRLTARPDNASGEPVVELLGEQRIRDGRIYVADPFGKLVISYSPDSAQKGMLEDLQGLLKLAAIG